MTKPLSKPCDNCPFLKREGIPLRPGRLAGIIADMKLRNATFYCHKTCNGTEQDDDEYVKGGKEASCAGATIYMLKHGLSTQMMRIEERLGMINVEAMLKKHADKVIDNLRQARKIK